jgi:DNA-binding ferritin-like protein
MADAIEKKYTTGLIAVLKDANRSPITRVNAFQKLNDMYEVIDNKQIVLTAEQLDKTLLDIFNKHMEPFNDEETKLVNALNKNPDMPIDETFEGGNRKRSMKRRSIKRKRSSMKRSTKRSMKRSTKRSMKRRSFKKHQTKSGYRTYSTNGIVATLTEMGVVVKLHHWRTHDYSVHKATDNLHEALSEQVDSFVEKLLGSKHTRSNLTSLRMRSYNTLPALKQRVEHYKRYLKGMPASLGTDLLNIRDELLGSLNQFSYMLSLH